MNTILTIAVLVVAVTALVVVQAIVVHAKTKDTIKLIEAKIREEEARKSAAETEKKSQEAKAELASKLSTLTEEQLATYNRTLEEIQRPVMQYVPVAQFVHYTPYGPQVWRGW